jgi:hypothetical protein
MPASKLNYIVVYPDHSQVYGCSSKKIALDSPAPEGYNIEDKNIFFITFEPDTNNICLHKVNEQKESNEQETIDEEKD